MANELREILLKLRQCAWYPDRCSECVYPKECKKIIDKATSEIKSLFKSKLPKRTCPIIRALDKRLKCKLCVHLNCKSKIKNDTLTEIEKIVEDLFK